MSRPASEINFTSTPKLAEWYASNHHSTWLRMMLGSDEGRLLIDVLKEFSLPKSGHPDGIPFTEIRDRLALQHTLDSGVFLCIQNILGLATPQEELTEIPTSSAWLRGADEQTPAE